MKTNVLEQSPLAAAAAILDTDDSTGRELVTRAAVTIWGLDEINNAISHLNRETHTGALPKSFGYSMSPQGDHKASLPKQLQEFAAGFGTRVVVAGV